MLTWWTRSARYALAILVLTLVALAGSQWISTPMQGSPFWPAAGVGLALVWRYGPSMVFAVAAGDLLAGLLSGAHHALSWPILGALALEEIFKMSVTYALLRRWGRRAVQLATLREWGLFLVLAALPLGVLGAGTGVLIDHLFSIEQPMQTYMHWLTGDVLGVLFFAPPLLLVSNVRKTVARWPNPWLRVLGLFASVAALSALVSWYSRTGVAVVVLVLPVLLWAAMRFGPAVTTWIAMFFATASAVVWVQMTSSAFLSFQMLVAGVLAAGMVTALVSDEAKQMRRQLETTVEQLKESQERIARIFHLSPDAICFSRSHDGLVAEINAGFARLFGLDRETSVGRTSLELGIWPSPIDRIALIAEVHAKGEVRDLEITMHHRSGAPLCVRFSARETRVNGEVYLVSILNDITEQRAADERLRRSERQLQQAQKLEAIGTLASGIAHDFNNVLSAVNGNAELAQLDLPPKHPSRANMQQVLQASQRAAGLIQQILTFTRKTESKRVVSKVTPIVKETLRFLKATIPASIELRHRVIDSPAIACDLTQLHQVMLNLCTNAVHAMKSRPGLIEIVEETAEVDGSSEGALAELTPGKYLRLRVLDTGCGMTPEVARRVFDPFFTTKKPGEGTGLGLSVVHGIMRNHRGAVTISSTPGQGTVFHLYFPVAPVGETETPPVQPEAAPRGRGQRVLLLDDEIAIVQVAERLLRSLGYEVEAFSAPEAGLARLAGGGHFDVVLTDLMMPRITGLMVAERVRGLAPELPVVLASGFLSDEALQGAREQGVVQTIDKPYTLDALGRAISAALRSTPAPTGRS